jgi:hypothetical protein
MSKANILKTEKLPGGKVRLTFDAADGKRTYEYSGRSARAVNRGTDPSGLSGRLVEHKKPKN